MPAILVVLGMVAVAGLALGLHHSSSVAMPAAGTVSVGALTIEDPPSWRVLDQPPHFVNLRMDRAIGLAPAGSAGAGLLGGTLTETVAGPLPPGLLAALPAIPKAQVVEGLGAQAYRYNLPGLLGGDRLAELYVIPSPGEDASALLCFAPRTQPRLMQQCRQIVASLTASSVALQLTPDVRYSKRLAGALGALRREWTEGRTRLSQAASPGDAAAVADQLAASFATALTTLASVEPPSVLSRAQTALLNGLRRANTGYQALAAAAAGGQPSAYNAARSQVGEAEDAVDQALARYALYGYRQAG